jgi:hypothetical protein
VDGFPTAGGRNPPSALANERIFGMLFLACGRGVLGRIGPATVEPSGNRRLFFDTIHALEKHNQIS